MNSREDISQTSLGYAGLSKRSHLFAADIQRTSNILLCIVDFPAIFLLLNLCNKYVLCVGQGWGHWNKMVTAADEIPRPTKSPTGHSSPELVINYTLPDFWLLF